MDAPELLTARQASDLCGIPASSLHDYACRLEAGLPQQGPPHVALGPRRRRWVRADVLAWVEARRVGDSTRPVRFGRT